MTPSSDIAALKSSLRSSIRSAVAALTPDQRRTQSIAACRRLLASDAFRRARRVMLYAPMSREPDCAELAIEALTRGVALHLPRIAPGAELLEVVPITHWAPHALPRSPLGPRQPQAGLPAVDPRTLDLILVPGVVFDLACHRLGQGKGYYDRFLTHAPAAAKVAIAFDEQVLSQLPVDPWDIQLDAVFTPTRVLSSLKPS